MSDAADTAIDKLISTLKASKSDDSKVISDILENLHLKMKILEGDLKTSKSFVFKCMNCNYISEKDTMMTTCLKCKSTNTIRELA